MAPDPFGLRATCQPERRGYLAVRLASNSVHALLSVTDRSPGAMTSKTLGMIGVPSLVVSHSMTLTAFHPVVRFSQVARLIRAPLVRG